jgi:hypothetical protein
MNKRDGKRRKRRRQQQARKQHPTLLKRLFRILKSPIGFAIAFIGLMIGVVSLWLSLEPKVSVEPDEPVVRSSAVNVPFRVINESELPIYSLTSNCDIRSLSFSGGGYVQRVKLTSESVISRLGPREPTSIVHHTATLGRPKGNRSLAAT